SSADYSKRQEGYARALRADNVFTPQLVIDGESQLNGSDRRAAVAAIARAVVRRKATVTLVALPAADAPPQKMAWRITIDAASLAPRPAAAYLFYAITEDGLAS